MFLTLENFFSEEPSALVQVDASQIDVSEFKDEEDQSFLLTHGHELLRIDAKAEQAKEQICKAIDARAGDAKGKLIYEIQERFHNTPELKGGLLRYFYSMGYWDPNMKKMDLAKPEKFTSLAAAFSWANAYRAALEMQLKFKDSLTPEEIQAKASTISTSVLGKLYTTCSEEHRGSIYNRIVQGESFTKTDAAEISKDPSTKLSKAEELLEAARERKRLAEERWEEVQADPDITWDDPEYQNSRTHVRHTNSSVENFEQKILDLQAQVEAKESELNKFKFDEDLKRQERIKALTSALTVGVPQATADLNKYIKDAEYYPSEVRRHFDDQIKVLADMCGDYLSRI